MKFQNKPANIFSKSYLFLILILISLMLFLLSRVKVNIFSYTGDLNYIDQQRIKILSLNHLKDQPLFWINKSDFERILKMEMPQIKFIKYNILNAGHLEININAEDICCIVTDINEKRYVVSKDGFVLRDHPGNFNSEFRIISEKSLTDNERLSRELIKSLISLINKETTIYDIKDNAFHIDQDLIFFYTSDSKKIIINQNTDFKKINENIKNMKSYLEQNQKNYSILDFRFEKIVVK